MVFAAGMNYFYTISLGNIQVNLNTLISTYVVMAIVIALGVVYYIRVNGILKKLEAEPDAWQVLVPGKFDVVHLFEVLIEYINSLNRMFLGARLALKYMPWLASYFILILAANYFGLLPSVVVIGSEGQGPSLTIPPTSDFNTTLGLTLISIIGYNILAIKETGFKNWLAHFAYPLPEVLPQMFGSRQLFLIVLGVLFIPMFILMNVLEVFTRTVSLSVRLFGNIFGGHNVIEIPVYVVASGILPAGIIGGFIAVIMDAVPVFVMMLKVIMGFIQALIFTVLTAAYVGGYLHGFEEEHA